jgi:hypothetical protein
MSCGQAHRGGLGCLGLGKEALRAVETGVHVGMSRRVDGGWPCGGGNAAELRVHAQGEVTVRSTEAVSVACARGKVPGWWHLDSCGKSMAWAATEDRRKYLIYPEECLLPLDDTSTYDDI